MSGICPPGPRLLNASMAAMALGLLLIISPLSLNAQEAAAPQTLTDSAVIVTILGGIDAGTVEEFRDTVEALKTKELRFLIIKLDTPGGTIDASRELAEYIDNLADKNIETFGWVPNGTSAYS